MRIAIDARLMGGTNTGDSTYWTCLVNTLLREHPEHEYLLISNRAKPANVPESAGVRWIELAGEGRMWSLVRLPLLARRLKADVLHVQYSLSPLARNGVTTIHDVSFFVGPQWFSERDRMMLQRSIPISARFAKRIVTVSETSAREIEQFVPESRGKVDVAQNARPPWISRMESSEYESALAGLGVVGPYFLTVGTKWARKNQEMAVRAVRALDLKPTHRLVLTGKQTEELASDRIQPVGYVSEAQLSALYSGASAYLAPSFHEGFGIPLLEAMHCGAPVICGSGGAMPEVVGEAGIVVPTYDDRDWTSSLADVCQDASKLTQLREMGFVREREFTWEESARKHLRAYEEACRK